MILKSVMPLSLGFLQTERTYAYVAHMLKERKPAMARLSLRISKQKMTTKCLVWHVLGISEEEGPQLSIVSRNTYVGCFVIQVTFTSGRLKLTLFPQWHLLSSPIYWMAQYMSPSVWQCKLLHSNNCWTCEAPFIIFWWEKYPLHQEHIQMIKNKLEVCEDWGYHKAPTVKRHGQETNLWKWFHWMPFK